MSVAVTPRSALVRANSSRRCVVSKPSNFSFKQTREKRAPLNSSVRLHKRFPVSGKSTPACRSRSAPASFLRCVSGRPACGVCWRLVGFRYVRACVCSRIHSVFGGRGALQLHHLVSGFVCRTQALTISCSCSVFGVALSSIKGRASVPPNSSFKADGCAAA